MARVIDGVRVPALVAGHPGLELCNTRAGWPGPATHEYLVSPRALVVWAVTAGLLPAGAAVPAPNGADDDGDRAALAAAIELRGRLYRCALAVSTVTGPVAAADADDWWGLADAVRRAQAVATLGPDPGGGRARWSLPVPGQDLPIVRAAVHAAALAADAFLTGPASATTCACPGAGCGWLFTDPRRRRRWCTMSVCGNRAKARRHAERLKSP